jgi:hypothetical protein
MEQLAQFALFVRLAMPQMRHSVRKIKQAAKALLSS